MGLKLYKDSLGQLELLITHQKQIVSIGLWANKSNAPCNLIIPTISPLSLAPNSPITQTCDILDPFLIELKFDALSMDVQVVL